MDLFEVRLCLSAYEMALRGQDTEVLDAAHDAMATNAPDHYRFMLAEIDRLTADLAAMTAERDALNHCLEYERGAKAAFEIRWRVENAKYNKSVVHLQRARGQRDTLNVELERMQKEVDKLPTYESANSGLHDKLCAAAAERDAWQRRAEAAEQYIRDMLYDATLLVDSALCDFCECWDKDLCWAGDCKAQCGMRGPTDTAASAPQPPAQPTQLPPQAAQAPEPDA